MNEIFGISMTTIMIVLLSLLSLCLLTVAWVAIRRPVVFKMGMRNIPRRKAQTVLIVVGLMLSTLIISAALGVGDTVDYSITDETYRTYGHIDEQIVPSEDIAASASAASSTSTMDASLVDVVDKAVAGNSNVDGVLPVLRVQMPGINETKNLAEPSLTVVGIDTTRVTEFGGFDDSNGNPIDLQSLPADSVVLGKTAAENMDASVGDSLTLYYNNQPITFTVSVIADDTYLTGFGRNASTGFEEFGMAMSLDRLQSITGLTGRISTILVSNTGGVRDSVAATDTVVESLSTQLQGQGVGIFAIKQESVDAAKLFSSIFTSLFLVLGLFSIAAGVLLIILIFTMLAAERRSEMGMARAVGQHRRQLIHQFIAEGSGYAVLSGMVGAALGIVAALGIGAAMGWLFGDFVDIQPHVTVRSLVVAYSLGVVITFLAVAGSSIKISRLNVVAAIRDITEVHNPRRKKRTLVWAALLLLIGGATTMAGVNSESAFPFYAGMSLLPFGIALLLRFIGAPSRPVFSAVGFFLVIFWLLPDEQFEQIFGNYDGGIEMFFLSGIFMVIGATIVIIQNTDWLLAGVSAFGGLFKSKLPAVRTAVAYPGAARGRTGMTIAMFSLIIFSLVMIATMNQNYVNLFLGDDANAGWEVRADALAANPIDDFTGTLAQKNVDTTQFSAVGVVTNPSDANSALRLAGEPDWKEYPVLGMDEGFITSSTLKFGQRAEGYATDADVVRALATEPNVAVVDAFAIPANEGFGGGENTFSLTGFSADDKVFAPVTVELAKPDTGESQPVKIIGVIDSKIGSLFGLYVSQTTIDAVYPSLTSTSYFIKLKDADQSNNVANSVEAALLQNGVQAVSIEDQLKDNQRQSTGFLYLIQGFMGLGLFVGVAAIGVIAFRSVVERRQQIGVLRAIGFQQGLVSLSFLIETAFVVGVGCISGTVLGLVLARNLFTSDSSASNAGFLIPWSIILVVISATMAVALLMAWIPSRQASRIAPAEALRYE